MKEFVLRRVEARLTWIDGDPLGFDEMPPLEPLGTHADGLSAADEAEALREVPKP